MSKSSRDLLMMAEALWTIMNKGLQLSPEQCRNIAMEAYFKYDPDFKKRSELAEKAIRASYLRGLK